MRADTRRLKWKLIGQKNDSWYSWSRNHKRRLHKIRRQLDRFEEHGYVSCGAVDDLLNIYSPQRRLAHAESMYHW